MVFELMRMVQFIGENKATNNTAVINPQQQADDLHTDEREELFFTWVLTTEILLSAYARLPGNIICFGQTSQRDWSKSDSFRTICRKKSSTPNI